jgi:centractin
MADEEFLDLPNQPIVLDNGSGVLKAGFAGDNEPKCVFPSIVGRPKHTRVMAGSIEGDFFIGSKAQEHRGMLAITNPMEHGIVTNLEDMERVWSSVFTDELKTSPEEHPVLVTEPPLNPKKNREKLAEIFFEIFNIPALFISMQAVLALYASGKTTGVVLDSGDGVTHCVPIYEGFALPHSIRRIDLAGRDVTRQLQLLLRKAGRSFTTSAEMQIVQQIKEACCYVAFDPAKEADDQVQQHNYKLPDGSTIQIGSESFYAPEILFKPHLVGREHGGLHDVVVESIGVSDIDLRKTLYQSILLSGGTTLTEGLGKRLLNEVKSKCAKDMKIKILAPPERKFSTWIGGSILASLGTFRKMSISGEEYRNDSNDKGELLHSKSFF